VPLQDVEEKHLMITRQRDDGKGGDNHFYPYDTLPRLISHLQPRFAIFNAGSKLNKLMEGGSTNPEFTKVLDNHPDIDLNMVIMLYDAWIRPIPYFAVKDESYVEPNTTLVRVPNPPDSDDPEDSDYVGRRNCGRILTSGDGLLRPRTRSVAAEQDRNDDDHDHLTESGRGDGWHIRPNKRRLSVAAEQESAGLGVSGTLKAPAVKKRKVFSALPTHNQQFLSEATLSSFNQHLGVAAWTGDRIRQWSTSTKKKKIVPSFTA
jgi:hypothetical protein